MSTTMESPLTQQSRPETFKPKIVQLYENLFHVPHPLRPRPILKGKKKEYLLIMYRALTMLNPRKDFGGSSSYCRLIELN